MAKVAALPTWVCSEITCCTQGTLSLVPALKRQTGVLQVGFNTRVIFVNWTRLHLNFSRKSSELLRSNMNSTHEQTAYITRSIKLTWSFLVCVLLNGKRKVKTLFERKTPWNYCTLPNRLDHILCLSWSWTIVSRRDFDIITASGDRPSGTLRIYTLHTLQMISANSPVLKAAIWSSKDGIAKCRTSGVYYFPFCVAQWQRPGY